MKINILLNNNFFNDHCAYGFAFPIFKSLDLINESGIKINFFYSYKKKFNQVLVNDKFFSKKEVFKEEKKFIKENKFDYEKIKEFIKKN